MPSIALRQIERSINGKRDVEAVTTNHDRLRQGQDVTNAELASDYLASAQNNTLAIAGNVNNIVKYALIMNQYANFTDAIGYSLMVYLSAKQSIKDNVKGVFINAGDAGKDALFSAWCALGGRVL